MTFDEQIKESSEKLVNAEHADKTSCLYDSYVEVFIAGANAAREILQGETNYDEWRIESDGLKIKHRVMNCPDCKKRVETYMKSIKEFQGAIDKLSAELQIAEEKLRVAYMNEWHYIETTFNTDKEYAEFKMTKLKGGE